MIIHYPGCPLDLERLGLIRQQRRANILLASVHCSFTGTDSDVTHHPLDREWPMRICTLQPVELWLARLAGEKSGKRERRGKIACVMTKQQSDTGEKTKFLSIFSA